MKPLTFTSKQEKGLDASQKKLVLYVEDDANNQQVVAYRIGKKYNLLFAANAEDACRILSERGKELFVVLMDIELKDSKLNGIELTKLIRGLLDRGHAPEYARLVPVLDLPVFLVTSYGKKYQADLTSCGADGVVLKPVEFAELEEALINCKRTKPA